MWGTWSYWSFSGRGRCLNNQFSIFSGQLHRNWSLWLFIFLTFCIFLFLVKFKEKMIFSVKFFVFFINDFRKILLEFCHFFDVTSGTRVDAVLDRQVDEELDVFKGLVAMRAVAGFVAADRNVVSVRSPLQSDVAEPTYDFFFVACLCFRWFLQIFL